MRPAEPDVPFRPGSTGVDASETGTSGTMSPEASTVGSTASASPGGSRLRRLRESLAETELDALLISHLPNVRYLTGFTGTSALLLVRPVDGATLITDFRYEEQASDQLSGDVVVWIARDGLLSELGERLDRAAAPGRIGFEGARLTVRDRRELSERCRRAVWEEAPSLVEEMRARKDEDEVDQLRRAVEIAESAFARTLAGVTEGIAERQVAAELEYALRLAGSETPPFPAIVAAGPRSSLPHAEPGDRPLREGDLLLFDFGATSGGYGCDLTRTVTLGPSRDWQRQIHDAVREAQEAAIAAVRPGVPAREVDAVARGVLEERGFADRFGHGTGHGIGLEVHEAPRLARTSEDILREGHVVTVEPGVYLPGRGGVRIEDDLIVSAEGARMLTRVSRDLVEL